MNKTEAYKLYFEINDLIPFSEEDEKILQKYEEFENLLKTKKVSFFTRLKKFLFKKTL